MADIVKFKSGSKDNLLGTPSSNALPIIPGTVYFAIDDNNKGYLYFDKDSTHRIWMGMADHANSATYDNNNRKIEDTYLKGIEFDGTTNTAKVTAILEKGSGDKTTKVDLPNAGASSAGVITTGAQTIAGNKTFTGAFVSSGGATFSNTNFEYSAIEAATSNTARVVWFAHASIKGRPVYDNSFTYNPSTKTLVAENISGTASRAVSDAAGHNIEDTYIPNAIGTAAGDMIYWTANGTPARLAKGSNGQVLKISNGLPVWSSDTDTDTKVKLTTTSTSASYPIVLGPSNVTSGTAVEAFYNSNISVNPNTSTITATTFNGTATRASADSSGISFDNYIKGISVSGRTITVTQGSGSTYNQTVDASIVTIRRWEAG